MTSPYVVVLWYPQPAVTILALKGPRHVVHALHLPGAASGPCRSRRPGALPSSSLSNPFTAPHALRDFQNYSAMIELTAQRHGKVDIKTNTRWWKATSKARGERSMRILMLGHCCMQWQQSVAIAGWTLHSSSSIALSRVPRDSIPSVRFSSRSVRRRASVARCAGKVSRVRIRVFRRMMFVMCRRGARVERGADYLRSKQLTVGPEGRGVCSS